MKYRYTAIHLISLGILLHLLGVLVGISLRIDRDASLPRWKEDTTQPIPVVGMEQLDGTTLTLSTNSEVRLLYGSTLDTLSPEEQLTVDLSLLPSAVGENLTLRAEDCNFAARSTGSVYYIATSSEGKQIPPEKRRCFATEDAARDAGYTPSKSIQ